MLQRAFTAVRNLLRRPSEIVTPQTILSSPPRRRLTAEEQLDLAIQNHISQIRKRPTITQDESFFVADLGQVIRQHQRWTQNLPDVRPFYGTNLLPQPNQLQKSTKVSQQ